MKCQYGVDIKAVILAGGLGTRLRSIISDKPKVLAEVNGRPFLDYLLNQVDSFGIKSVVLCTGYMGEQVEAIYGKRYRTLELSYSHEHEPLGTGGALSKAANLIDTKDALVLNGDSYCNINWIDFYLFHLTTEAKISIALTDVPDVSRYGSVTIKINGLVEKFDEKGGSSGSGVVNAGLYLMNSSVISSIPNNTYVSLEKEIFPKYINTSLFGYKSGQDFIDIGIPSDYETAQKFSFNTCSNYDRSL